VSVFYLLNDPFRLLIGKFGPYCAVKISNSSKREFAAVHDIALLNKSRQRCIYESSDEQENKTVMNEGMIAWYRMLDI